MGTMLILALISIFFGFTLSASAGLGGSLILVPAMSIILGVKQGVAVAALLLACNNIGKVIAFRNTIPLGAASWIILMTMLGVVIGAGLMVTAPEALVHGAIIAGVILSFFFVFRKARAQSNGQRCPPFPVPPQSQPKRCRPRCRSAAPTPSHPCRTVSRSLGRARDHQVE